MTHVAVMTHVSFLVFCVCVCVCISEQFNWYVLAMFQVRPKIVNKVFFFFFVMESRDSSV